MPITHTRGENIRGWVDGTNVQKETAKSLIYGDRFIYDEIFRNGTRTITNIGNVRVDHQGDYDGTDGMRHHNIQVQIGGQTAAHVDVSESLQQDDPANQRGVLHAVQKDLVASMYDGHSYFVAGSIP